jgi:hypothetical protein
LPKLLLGGPELIFVRANYSRGLLRFQCSTPTRCLKLILLPLQEPKSDRENHAHYN